MQKKKRGLYREHSTYHGVAYDITARTKPELREKVRRRQNEIDAQLIQGDITVMEWIDQWFEIYVLPRRISQQTKDYKRSVCANRIIPKIGHLKVKDVRAAHLQAILNDLDLKKSTGEKNRQVIKQIFREAKNNRLIAIDPAESIRCYEMEGSTARRSITDYERELITEECYYHRGGLWVMLMLKCGLRPSESCVVQKKDLMTKDKTLHVVRALDRHSGRIKPPKTKAGVRDIPIPDSVFDFLFEWPWWRDMKPFDYIVTTIKDKRPLRANAQETVWKAMIRDINLRHGGVFYRNELIESVLPDDFTPYLLRHTYCTDLQAAGVPLNVARELMGHEDISTTANIYTHSSAEAISTAITAINALDSQRREKNLPQYGEKYGD